MKQTFIEYHSYESDVVIKMWEEALFVFDSNVILSLYRYSPQTSEMFIDVINSLSARIWLPHQVGLEFYGNRLGVISEQKKHYETFLKNLNTLIQEVENKNRNPFFSSKLTEKITNTKNDIHVEIREIIEVYDKFVNIDPLLEKVNNTFENKVGDEYSKEKVGDIQKQGEKRYKTKVHPGYCDDKKPIQKKYGDLILWNQIIDKAKVSKCDVIFILDDRKEDWWLEHQGKTISPRPELLKEFRTLTSQQVHFYKPFQFLEYSNKYLKRSVKDEVIEEVKNYSEEHEHDREFIQINLTLQGDTLGFNNLYNNMRETGYNVTSETSDSGDIHFLTIILPNIPDLERRLHSRYLSDLQSYNLILSKKTTS